MSGATGSGAVILRPLIIADQLRRSVPGGIGTYIRGLVAGLRELGMEPSLYAGKKRASAEADSLQELGLTVFSSALLGPLMTRLWDVGVGRLPGDFDLVHAASLALPPRGNRPLTAMVHDLAWRHFPEAYPVRGRKWHEAALARASSRCDALFTPSEKGRADLLDAGVEAHRVHVVIEGCDHLPEPDHEGARLVLKRAGVEGSYLLTVGTLEPRKNFSTLFSAYEAASRALPERWPLVVVGPSGWGVEAPAPENVIALGPLSPKIIAGLYANCRAFVSVPLLEGWGLPVAEAMAMGAPVVSSDVPSAGGATLIVDPLDADAIAHAVVQVATDEAIRADLIARGKERAAELTWAKAAYQHIEVWERLGG